VGACRCCSCLRAIVVYAAPASPRSCLSYWRIVLFVLFRAKVFGPYSDNIVPSHLKGEYPGGRAGCLRGQIISSPWSVPTACLQSAAETFLKCHDLHTSTLTHQAGLSLASYQLRCACWLMCLLLRPADYGWDWVGLCADPERFEFLRQVCTQTKSHPSCLYKLPTRNHSRLSAASTATRHAISGKSAAWLQLATNNCCSCVPTCCSSAQHTRQF
jgi:hypothetical protein